MSRAYATPADRLKRQRGLLRRMNRAVKMFTDQRPVTIPDWLFTDCQEADVK